MLPHMLCRFSITSHFYSHSNGKWISNMCMLIIISCLPPNHHLQSVHQLHNHLTIFALFPKKANLSSIQQAYEADLIIGLFIYVHLVTMTTTSSGSSINSSCSINWRWCEKVYDDYCYYYFLLLLLLLLKVDRNARWQKMAMGWLTTFIYFLLNTFIKFVFRSVILSLIVWNISDWMSILGIQDPLSGNL